MPFCELVLMIDLSHNYYNLKGNPYCMEAEGPEEKVGNDRFQGYCIDLIKEIAQVLEFKYTIKLVDDGVHGRKNERQEWNGMIKELIEGVSDFFRCIEFSFC